MSVADTMVAVIEDDPGIRDLVTDLLRREGFEVLAYADAASFFRSAPVERLDCLILDVMLPGEDGLSICRTLRAARPRLPILMVSAKGDDVDRIVGLEMGAEDYLPKPCNPRELLARVRTVLRRNRRQTSEPQVPAGQRLRFAGWQVDMGVRLLTDPDNVVVTLTDGEFRLLRAFIEHPRRVLSRDQLLDYSAGSDAESYDRAIDVQLSRLRRKLGDDPREPVMIRTVRGDGYLFAPAVTRC